MGFQPQPGRRHRHALARSGNRLDDEAILRIADDNCRAGLAAFEQTLTRIDTQAGGGLLSMAAVAFRGEYGPDFGLKKVGRQLGRY